MQIVPTADALVVEARVAPQDIDQVRVGQPAALRLSAFSQQTTPEVEGQVDRISPDLIEDQKAGVAYYAVRIALTQSSLKQAGQLELKPGMPAEVFLRTGERTVLSYLLKPLTDQASRAFRGDCGSGPIDLAAVAVDPAFYRTVRGALSFSLELIERSFYY
ncbi:MAG: HlyD family efflux transporter periplasmic adaptor subunit, partial [Mesorhizobium sp.]